MMKGVHDSLVAVGIFLIFLLTKLCEYMDICETLILLFFICLYSMLRI